MLFDTHEEIDHLTQIITCIGPMPSALVGQMTEETYNAYFDQHGRLDVSRAKVSKIRAKNLLKYFPRVHSDLSERRLYDLLRRMLQWQPEARITAFKSLKHPFFQTQSYRYG